MAEWPLQVAPGHALSASQRRRVFRE